MLVNYDDETKEEHVEFVSYSGRFPNLCDGVLVLKIDGKEYNFGHNYDNYDCLTHKFKGEGDNYDKFWISGGGLDEDYCAYQGKWKIMVNHIPEQFRKYAFEIDRVFNDNVDHGCCGGCYLD
jgi:hypothetical protein